MQTETLNKTLESTLNRQPYLRIATVSGKATLTYMYIGDEEESISVLENSFRSGFQVSSFEEAKYFILNNGSASQSVDVLFIDVPYSPSQVRDFWEFCGTLNLFVKDTPIIYCADKIESQMLIDREIVDDVVQLKGWQFDFSTKVSFLRKIKQSNRKTSFRKNSVKPERSIMKRVLDVTAALVMLIILLPVLLLIALAIKIESKGPIFYIAKRAGRGFKIFKFYKFRTMVVNADKKIQELAHLNQYAGSSTSARFFKLSNDPRITRVGKFLRNTSLDELPQLLNVLLGDMSLVGNRPLPLYEAATLTTNEYVERFMAPAGITGLWQIKKRGQAEMSIEERIGLDIDYARKSNLLYDFWIMANTPGALFQKSNV